MSETIIIAVISLAGTLFGSYFANKKSTALFGYRLDQIENKLEKHNHLVERVYKVESDLNTAFIRIDELREDVKEK